MLCGVFGVSNMLLSNVKVLGVKASSTDSFKVLHLSTGADRAKWLFNSFWPCNDM